MTRSVPPRDPHELAGIMGDPGAVPQREVVMHLVETTERPEPHPVLSLHNLCVAAALIVTLAVLAML